VRVLEEHEHEAEPNDVKPLVVEVEEEERIHAGIITAEGKRRKQSVASPEAERPSLSSLVARMRL
jgi:hypothetical protein